jgi:FG-GAP-like repeat
MKTLTKILVSIFLLGSLSIVKAEKLLDFDGDGISDFVVIRNNGTTREWHISRSSDGIYYAQPFGSTNNGWWDEPTPADYDGDGKTDVAIWRRSTQPGQSAFYILNSSNQTVRIEYMGQPGDFVNVFGDYDGDGKADPAVYRRDYIPFANKYIYRGSLNNPGGVDTTVAWGSGADFSPYRGDFDGDGKLDFCLRRNSNATFSLKRSSDGGTEVIAFGKTNDVFAPGDYDGDGRTDFCVERLGKGNYYNWFIYERDGGGTGPLNGIRWGQLSALPTPQFSGGDFDGDCKADIGVYSYEHNSQFEIRRSGNQTLLAFHWGNLGNADNVIQINYGF